MQTIGNSLLSQGADVASLLLKHIYLLWGKNKDVYQRQRGAAIHVQEQENFFGVGGCRPPLSSSEGNRKPGFGFME